MTPKMATDKVNAPAVSQLAGEIADRVLIEAYGIYLQTLSGTVMNELKAKYADIISAALSEREEKIAKLIEAAEEMDSPTSWWDSDMRTCRFCGSENFDSHGLLIHGAACRVLKLRAALSALGESK